MPLVPRHHRERKKKKNQKAKAKSTNFLMAKSTKLKHHSYFLH